MTTNTPDIHNVVEVPFDTKDSVERQIVKIYNEIMSGRSFDCKGKEDESVINAASSSFRPPLPPIDPRMKRFWCKSITSGARSMDDYVSNILQSDAYMHHVFSRFKSAWVGILGSDVPFNAKHLKSLREEHYRKQPVSDEKVCEQIKATTEFSTKFNDVVQSCAFLSLDGKELTKQEAEEFVNKFRVVPGYTTELLRQDLLERFSTPLKNKVKTEDSEQPAETTNKDDDITKVDTPLAKDTGDDDPINRMKTLLKSRMADDSKSMKKTNYEEPITTNDGPGPVPREASSEWTDEEVKTMLKDFFDVYNRPMFVQEYRRILRIKEEQGGRGASSEPVPVPVPDKNRFGEERVTFNLLSNVVKNVYSRFTDHEITEYEIVDEWLHLLGCPLEIIEDTVTKNIVDSELYARAMRARIVVAHGSLFDAESRLTDYDIDCLYEIAKREMLDLKGEELYERVRVFQYQTDKIHARINDVYAAVFDRPPDGAELDSSSRVYREDIKRQTAAEESRGGGDALEDISEDVMAKLDRELECRLVSDLEFHDILKKRIKCVGWDRKDGPLSGRMLYDVLRRVLKMMAQVPPGEMLLGKAFDIVDVVCNETDTII